MEAFPDSWADFQPDTVYLSTSGLSYDENLEFVDENWFLAVDSPMLEIS